ncbi:hypothetical protein LPJ61_006380, partial [Coemansia biformis]
IVVYGPSSMADPLKARAKSARALWSSARGARANLEAILECTLPEPGSAGQSDIRLECGVCFEFARGTETADQLCGSDLCAQPFHRSCLAEWLATKEDTRQSFSTLFGRCPYCNGNVTVARTHLVSPRFASLDTMPPATICFWFEFASPYSMVSALRLARALAGGTSANAEAIRGLATCQLPDLDGLRVVYRPVFLGGLFKAAGQPALPNMQVPAKARYLFHDVKRSLDLLGCPGFPSTRPATWPPNTLLAGRMAWLLAQGPKFIRALEHADGPLSAPGARPLPHEQTLMLAEFVYRVFEAEFIANEDIGSAEVMARLWDMYVAGAPQDAGIPLPSGKRAVALANGDAARVGLSTYTSAGVAFELFGAPSFTTEDGAMYWGNDRLVDATAHHRIQHLLSEPVAPGHSEPVAPGPSTPKI